ncbi:MAG: pantetheine-phosphate adenylyltransferase [Prevotella sp.]|nr:pantetheine-phosphate adenylyltransferase [Prevotella sp.]MBQ6211219.1 pantetheine-phosphate adenylyltransferase [Prevotella sp.]
MTIAIFPGSFDPYTIGHHSVVRRILPLFDKLIIGIGINDQKHYSSTEEERVSHIAQIYASEKRIEVKAYHGLTIDFARQEGALFIVKGVRNVADFEYERTQADVNRRLSGIETIFLPAEPGMDIVSSSIVRELGKYGKDTSEFTEIR